MELKAYPFIVNGTFYKGVKILDYIENNKLMGIDREAVAATIMDALVYNDLIDKNMDSLDLKRFEIKRGSLVNYTYNDTARRTWNNCCHIGFHAYDSQKVFTEPVCYDP